jgi:hypothetical protein
MLTTEIQELNMRKDIFKGWVPECFSINQISTILHDVCDPISRLGIHIHMFLHLISRTATHFRVTAISGTTWTIERGTVPLTFSLGDAVYQRMNSQFADDLLRAEMQLLGQFAVAAGTGNAITASLDKTSRSLVDGMEVSIRAVGGNTVINPTLDLDSHGALPITRLGQQSLEIGDIPRAGFEMKLRYRATP